MLTRSSQAPSGDLRTLSRDGTGASPPSIPPPKFPWKTRVGVPGAILLALLLLLGYTAKDALWPARAVHVVPVVVKASFDQPDGAGGAGGVGTGAGVAPHPVERTQAVAAPGGASVQAPGWVEADPYPMAASALTGGVVREVLALEGQTVKAGEVVARLVDDDAKLALAKADAELAQRRAQLDAAQRQWDNPVEQSRAVAATEAMVAETRAELQKHHADLAVEEAKLAAAKDEAERNEQSFKQKATSELELIRSRQAFEAQRATADAVRAHEAVLKAQLAQREAELTAARENLRLRIAERQALDEATAMLALAQAARDEAALRLERTQVRSPADGVVMQRLVEPGSKLLIEMDDPRGAQAVRLYDPKRLQVRVDVPLADAAKVGVGHEATIVVGVLPDRTFKGRVTRVVNEADIQKNTLQVKVAITDPSPQLKPEMLARVRFHGASASPATPAGNPAAPTTGPAAPAIASAGAGGDVARGGGQLIFAPESLVHRHGQGADIWVVNTANSTASHRSVHLGSVRREGWISVEQGLAPGDQLIIETDGLSDGQKVRVVGEGEPPAQPAAGGGSNQQKEGDRGSH